MMGTGPEREREVRRVEATHAHIESEWARKMREE